MTPFTDSRVGAVVGVTHCGNYLKNLFTRFRAIEDEWITNVVTLGKSGEMRLSSFNLLSGANYALRRSAWESVGKCHGTTPVEDSEMTVRLDANKWTIEAVDANVWQEGIEGPGAYLRQRRRWYRFSVGDLIGKTNRIDHILALLPLTLQSSTFVSFLFFLNTLISNPGPSLFSDGGSLERLLPFILGNVAMILGLVRVGKPRLIPYILPYFIVDGALQAYCYLEAKLSSAKPGWVQLAPGKHYHVGTPIRTD